MYIDSMPNKSSRKPKPAKTNRTPLVVGVTAAALALLSTVTAFNMLRGEKVIEVLDGDTYRIENKQTVRLYSVDAPEEGRCMGKEAKEELNSLLSGKHVVLKNLRVGGFNRVMGYTYVDGESVELTMMKKGLVTLMRGTKDFPELLEASTYARQQKLGVFSDACYQMEPTKNQKCNIKGNIGETKKDRYYFTPSCSNYTQTVVWLSFGDQWFCTEKEAIDAGFVKGTKCK